jgi:hypothetical protein
MIVPLSRPPARSFAPFCDGVLDQGVYTFSGLAADDRTKRKNAEAGAAGRHRSHGGHT